MAHTFNGTVRDHPNFNVDADCQALHNAMKGAGTDEEAIIQVLATRSNAQRQQIRTAYKSRFGEDLIERLKSELSSDFENAVVALMLPPAEYDAAEANRAIKGAGTDEGILIELLVTRTNAEIAALKAAYMAKFKQEFEKDLKGDTSGDFRRLLVALLNGARKEGPADLARATSDAEALYRAGEAKWGTEESEFLRLLCAESPAHLRAVFDAYHKAHKKSMEQVIESEFSGHLKTALLAIVATVRDKPAYLAQCANEAMVGLGTRDRNLIRIIVSRSEIDLELVKKAYQLKYKKSLLEDVKSETSGDYCKILVKVIGN